MPEEQRLPSDWLGLKMSIWKEEVSDNISKNKAFVLSEINKRSEGCAVSHLGIEVTDISQEGLIASMPVDERTKQPFGLLHGGVSCVLSETLGSIAANMAIREKGFVAVGQEINANHLRPVTSGKVFGEATPIHLGKTSQVWQIKINNEQNKLVCISRLTLAVVPKPQQ